MRIAEIFSCLCRIKLRYDEIKAKEAENETAFVRVALTLFFYKTAFG
ncbi:MAG: hypothetical protein LBL74_07030 [Bacteroidales bacterium]|jgi:hypothetical protein|nr:hypothetical protein [Bacteroidales bacterium]